MPGHTLDIINHPMPQTTAKNSLAVVFGFLAILAIGGWYIGRNWFETQEEERVLKEGQELEIPLTDLKFFTAKEVLARLSRQENILLIDIRPKTSYDVEHIVDAISVPVTTLTNFAPGSNQLLIIIGNEELPNDTLKSIHYLFTERKFQFAFLQGTLADWRYAGGSTISSGDPESPFDYSKVIFINNDQVLPLTQELVSPLFLDVRSESLYKKSHLPGAINIPLDEMERRRNDIPRQKSLFVYGSNDFESYQGGVRLFDLGFFGARVIRGGFDLWQEKKLPTESETSQSPIGTPQ